MRHGISVAQMLAALLVSLPLPASAAEVSGAVRTPSGGAAAGVAVALVDVGTGLERTQATDASGRFAFLGVAPGEVELRADGPDGAATVRLWVAVGSVHDAELTLGAPPHLATPNHRQDVGQGDGAFEIGATLRLLPLDRSPEEVALLEPAVSPGDPDFGDGLGGGWFVTQPGQRPFSVRGGSLAENTVTLDGLDITLPRTRLQWPLVPVAALEQAQVDRGVVGPEHRGAPGGVLRLTTARGGNELHGGFSAYWSPESLQEPEPAPSEDVTFPLSAVADRESLELNASLGGPVIRDAFWFFGFVSFLDGDLTRRTPDLTVERSTSGPVWGLRLEAAVTPEHRLAGTVLDDALDIDEAPRLVDPPSGVPDDPTLDRTAPRGGTQWVARYDGVLADSLLVQASAGRSEHALGTEWDGDSYPYVIDSRADPPSSTPGNWARPFRSSARDERESLGASLEWSVGPHLLRGGLSRESVTSDDVSDHSGGVYYRYLDADPGAASPYEVRVRHYRAGGEVETESAAWWLADRWRPLPGLTVDVGVRLERFELDDATGATMLELEDSWAPRLSATWDPTGAGRDRLFASWGRFVMPASAVAAIQAGTGARLSDAYYEWSGELDPDTGAPAGFTPCGFGAACPDQGSVGDLLSLRVISDGEIPDPRLSFADSIEPQASDRLVVGWARRLGGPWRLTVTGVWQRLDSFVEDFTLDRGLWQAYGVDCYDPDSPYFGSCPHVYRIGNLGESFEGWYDLDDDGVLDRISLSREELGYPEVEREYRGVELDLVRELRDGWTVRAHYTWSHLEGNVEGPVDTLIGQDAVWTGQFADFPGLMDHSFGDLPSDRRHRFTGHASHAWPWGLALGGVLHFATGTPVDGRGLHPTDQSAQLYGAYSFYRDGEPCPRGCGGRTEDVWSLDLMTAWRFAWLGLDWDARVDVFNLLDDDAVVGVDEYAEIYDGDPNPAWRQPRRYQPPRSVRLGLALRF